MLIYSFRPDMVYSGPLEVPDGTQAIPKFNTFQAPPEIPEGYYAIMAGGWHLVEGTPPPYPRPPRVPTPEEIAAQLTQEVTENTQIRLDDFAKTRNYDGILSACTYASSSVPKFKAEGQYCVDVRDATWSSLYTLLSEVLAGNTAMPSGFSDVVPYLPTLTWPN